MTHQHRQLCRWQNGARHHCCQILPEQPKELSANTWNEEHPNPLRNMTLLDETARLQIGNLRSAGWTCPTCLPSPPHRASSRTPAPSSPKRRRGRWRLSRPHSGGRIWNQPVPAEPHTPGKRTCWPSKLPLWSNPPMPLPERPQPEPLCTPQPLPLWELQPPPELPPAAALAQVCRNSPHAGACLIFLLGVGNGIDPSAHFRCPPQHVASRPPIRPHLISRT
mmetsp:Transcript_47334/g.121801  ORF Transcript_47334/g.121801 Transcript_47334/m.121801 type:complete len:222 (+) Transcript_47334:402-1067(+)